MKKYCIFQDEAFHDLKITETKGETNFDKYDASPYFVNVFFGGEHKLYQQIEERYLNWERDNKRLLGIAENIEFKGESIQAKNFTFGFASMNLKYIKFYKFLFELISVDSLILHISTTNKFELLVSRVFSTNFLPIEYLFGIEEMRKMVYTLTKFIDRNRTDKLVKLMFADDSDNNEIITEIYDISVSFQKNNGSHFHLRRELQAAKFLECTIDLLFSNVESLQKYEWDYSWSIEGLKNLLSELNIPERETELYLDGKGYHTEGMYNAVKNNFKFFQIERVDSQDYAGTRIADFLSNFIGRMIKNINLDMRTGDRNNLIYLDESWFDLREEAFECYRLFGKILRKRQDIYWTTHTGLYGDKAIAFYVLIEYITSFDSFNSFSIISLQEHAKEVNECVKIKLLKVFGEIR